MKKVVAIGKFGRSIKFGRHLWKDGAGNNEPATLFSALANANPDNLYVLVGKSDFSRCKEEDRQYWFPHGNVLDAWKGFDSKNDDSLIYPYENVKHLKFDYGVMNGGITSEINTENTWNKRDKKTGIIDKDNLVKPLGMFAKGVGPLVYFLNMTNIKWVNFTADARQFPIVAKDLFNMNEVTFATINKSVPVKKYNGYGSYEEVTNIERASYGATECLLLLDPKYKGQSWFGGERDIKVGMFFHKYKDKKRIKGIKAYIDLFNDDEISVFGKWEEEVEAGDERFKGSLTFDEVQETLPRIKYTLCYPITPGDISAKWIESVRAGIVPFFDENYDTDYILNKVHKVPEFLYVKSPEEFKNKIDTLENTPSLYKDILNRLKNIHDELSDDILDHYIEMIDNEINK